ncbi:MAG: hypothetical protein ACREJ4_02595 [Candidatus Methylomirabilaceae bacterium]
MAQKVDVRFDFPVQNGAADATKDLVFPGEAEGWAPATADDIATARYLALGKAIEALAWEQAAYLGVQPEEHERVREAARDISIFDLLQWWPILQGFVAFANSVASAQPGDVNTSPEVRFPAAIAGRPRFLSLNVRTA